MPANETKRRVTDVEYPTAWQSFSKFVGVQGILAVILVTGYVIATLLSIPVTSEYLMITTGVISYYFAKNGVGILDILRRK